MHKINTLTASEVFAMLTEEFAEVVQIISGIAKKVQLVTDMQKQMYKKIETHIKNAEDIVIEHKEQKTS
jgi:hypothetical protein